MKKLFIFDCFGVLVGELAPIWFAKRYEPQKASELKQLYFGNADLGERTVSQLFDDLSAGLGIDKNVIIREFTEIFTINDELFARLEHWQEKYPQHDFVLLSNAPQGLVERIFDKYGFYKYFNKTFVSWQYKMAKPNREFYKLCVTQMNANYDKVFMIDDNSNNINGLEEIGITPVLYRNNEQLFERIEAEL